MYIYKFDAKELVLGKVNNVEFLSLTFVNRYTRDPHSSPHSDVGTKCLIPGPSLRDLTNRRLVFCPFS